VVASPEARLTRSWALELAGRPITANAHRRLHWRARARYDRQVREDFMLLALAAKIPCLAQVRIVAAPTVRRAPFADPAACAPAVKAAIDGIVDAGVIPDDTGQFVVDVIFHPPAKGERDALVVIVEEVAAA
jgi:crossover junction endodeoxyribonuclease RusA